MLALLVHRVVPGTSQGTTVKKTTWQNHLPNEGRDTLKSREAEPSEPASGKAGGEPARAPRFANSMGRAFEARASHHLKVWRYHISS